MLENWKLYVMNLTITIVLTEQPKEISLRPQKSF